MEFLASVDVFTVQPPHLRLMEPLARMGGKIVEPENQNVFCEMVSSMHDGEAAPKKFHQCDFLNKT